VADNRGFFQQMLGAIRPAQQAPVQQPPSYGYLVPPVQPPQQYAQQQQPQAYQQSQQPAQYDAVALGAAVKAKQVSIHDGIGLALNNPKRFFTARAGENQLCPECGDNRFFTRDNWKDKRTGMAPAPLCMACGYSGDVFAGEGHGTIGERYIDPNTPEAN
jgi:hypothetical protein